MQVQSQPQTHACFHLECLHMLGDGGVAAPAQVTVAQQSAAQHNPAAGGLMVAQLTQAVRLNLLARQSNVLAPTQTLFPTMAPSSCIGAGRV